jgi:caffeoyl-CoA O-methyltransferase
MSHQSMPVSARHIGYLADRTRREDPFLVELKADARRAGIPEIWISPEQASFMQILLRAARARDVVEVGTLAGYSAITMARALPAGGRVRTIELDPGRADFARRWIERSDVAGRVEVITGDARQVLPRLADSSADACFIDADKEGYRTYLDECVRLLRPSGLVLVDNAFAFGKLFEPTAGEEVQAILDFNDQMAARPDLHAIIVPLGDGCWVGVKVAQAAAAD